MTYYTFVKLYAKKKWMIETYIYKTTHTHQKQRILRHLFLRIKDWSDCVSTESFLYGYTLAGVCVYLCVWESRYSTAIYICAREEWKAEAEPSKAERKPDTLAWFTYIYICILYIDHLFLSLSLAARTTQLSLSLSLYISRRIRSATRYYTRCCVL